MQIIIPMSGIGKRFKEAGYTDPKPLINVDGYPMIKHVIDLFPQESNFTFICNDQHLKETKIREILTKLKPGCKIYEVPVGSKKGPVEVVLSIQDEIDDDEEVIVSYCDYGTVWNYENFLCDVSYRNLDGCIPCYTGFHPHMLGPDHYAYVKEDNKIALQVQEKKPFTDNKMSEYASNGTYYFKNGAILKKYFNKLVDSGETINDEYYVSMVYNAMIEDGLKVGVFEIQKMLQWGVSNDLEAYQMWSDYFRSPKEDKTVSCPVGTTLILPMAGRGSRFEIEGYKIPKPFIPVNGTIMVKEAVDCLPKCESQIFGCSAQHLELKMGDILKSYFPNGQIVSFSQTTKGQACTCEEMIKKSKINPEKPILISACDNGIEYNQGALKKLFDDPLIDVIVFTFRDHPSSRYSPNSYAWMSVDSNNNILSVSCKKMPEKGNIKKDHTIVGTMFFRKAKIFLEALSKDYLHKSITNGEYYVDNTIDRCIKSGLNVKAFEVDFYVCFGAPNDLKTYNYWREHFTKNENE